MLLLMGQVSWAQQTATSIRTPFSDVIDSAWLSELLPGATRFTEKSGVPPVIEGYRTNSAGNEELIGYLFLSSDLPPEVKGYSAPLDMLVGMNTELELTGIKVLNYTESFRYSRGDFVADADFLNQFAGKSILDEFRLRHDIDGLSGATISSFGISRGVRDAARRVAAAYLGYQEGSAEARIRARNARARLEQMDWPGMIENGVVQQVEVPMPVGSLQLSLTYMGRQVLGEYLIGAEDYARAERDASARFGGQEMLLLAVGGEAATQFRMERLALGQGDGDPRSIDPRRFVTAGSADQGVLAGHAAYAGAIVLDEDVDLNQPVEVIYRPPGQFEGVAIVYQLKGLNLDLYNDKPIYSPAEIARREMLQSDFLTRLGYGPPWANDIENDLPWQATAWGKLATLSVILVLVMTAFLRKSARLRWLVLVTTLIYLGFIDGGFLSISHLTSALGQGVSQITNNLPLLLLLLFTLVTTLLWGRVFCSSLCPFGAVQDLLGRFVPHRWQRALPQAIHDRALYLKYLFLALLLVMAVVASDVSLFQYFEPFGTLFFFSASVTLWAILVLFLAGAVIIPRFYCRYVCPLGAALAVLSLASPLRIKRVPQCQVCHLCEQACPTAAIRAAEIDFKECVRCDLCEIKLIEKAGSCKHDVETLNQRLPLQNRIPLQEI
jgi:hypothetical protein